MQRERTGSRHLGALLILGAVTATVFWPVLSHDFNAYDDEQYVTHNRHVQQGLTGDSLRWALTANRASNWHPLTWVSHMLDWELYGRDAGGHHQTSLILHVANTLLLFHLLFRLTGFVGRSAVVAVLFGVHPLHVESVAWVAERKDVLSTLFWILTSIAYTRYVRLRDTTSYAVAAAFLALGLAAKPMLVTLPFTLLLLDYWPLRRWEHESAGGVWFGVPRSLLVEKLPLFLLAAVSSLVTVVAQRSGGAVRSLEQYSMVERASNAIVAYVAYLYKALWPHELAVFYPHPGDTLAWPVVLVCVATLVGATVLAYRLRRDRPYALVGWLWYAGTLFPVIGLLQVGNQAMADRYTYVPLIGIFVAAIWGVAEISHRFDRVTWIRALAVAAVLAFALAARAQLVHWRDPVTLFERAVAVAESDVAHNNLGRALALRGQLEEAAQHYRRAIELNPRHEKAHSNLGHVLLELGRHEAAQRHFEEAIEIAPWYARPHGALGRLLMQQGRLREGVARFERALELDPGMVSAHVDLGRALQESERGAEAMRHFEQALDLDPDHAAAHVGLGVALAERRRFQEAVPHYEAALRARPDYMEAHNNLGSALMMLGRADLALAHFSRVVELRPDFAVGHYNLATCLYSVGRRAEARDEIELARRHGFEPPERVLKMMAEQGR